MLESTRLAAEIPIAPSIARTTFIFSLAILRPSQTEAGRHMLCNQLSRRKGFRPPRGFFKSEAQRHPFQSTKILAPKRVPGRPFKTSGVDAFHFGAAATVSPGGRILITKAVIFSPGANGRATAFFTGGMLCRNAAIASASSLERKENA